MPEQLAAHPWMQDSALADGLAKYSPAMAALIKNEQGMLKSSFCTGLRRGTGQLRPDDDATSYKWELIVRPSADEYRIKMNTNGAEFRLLMTPTKWVLYSGDDYTEPLGTGNITTH